MQPRNADPVAFLDPRHAVSHVAHEAHALVTRNKRQARLHWPVSVCRVQVGMANAGRGDFHHDLTVSRRRDWNLFDRERFAEFVHHRCFHGSRHRPRPPPQCRRRHSQHDTFGHSRGEHLRVTIERRMIRALRHSTYATVRLVRRPPSISHDAANACTTAHWHRGQPTFDRPANAPAELAFLPCHAPAIAPRRPCPPTWGGFRCGTMNPSSSWKSNAEAGRGAGIAARR